MEGKVSVIIPTYNRPMWLPETIESVLNQTYPNIEIIVVNDGSTDNTEQVLEPYRDRIKYIYKENGGPGSAVNAGIMASTGEYVARIDDDDLFLPEKVELQVKMFQSDPRLGLVATDHHIINPEGDIIYTREVPDLSKQGAFLFLLQHCIFSQPTVMVSKACYDKVGLYKNIYAQDYEMWIRIARQYPVGVIHKPLAMYRRHDLNRSGKISSEKVNADIRNFINEIMDNTSLEELVQTVYSLPHAYDIRGAIFIRHELYRKAGQEFYKSVKAQPEDMVHRFWSGILLRRLGQFQEANECFSKIPPESRLYEDSLKAIELTLRFESADHENEDVMLHIRQEFSEEHNKLMDITVSLARGQKI